MQKKISDIRRILIIAVALEAFLLFFFRVALSENIMVATVILIIEVVLFIFLFDRFDTMLRESATGVSEVLGESAKAAFLFGRVGMIMYDDDYVITWMSDLFEEIGINRVGNKVLSWLPEADPLISGGADLVTVQLDERIYEITRREDEPVLIFRDVTREHNAELSYEEEKPVLGIAVLDNYEEFTQYEDDTALANINLAVRSPISDYCNDHGILLKRISNSRYYMMLNEKIFSDLAADHFSLINTVRKAAAKQEIPVTLSMAFARGSAKYSELDEIAVKLITLAQSRGGDQVVVQKSGEEVKYFGGSTEAAEKRSRVRVRVMANSLRELINRSSNVIICGHRNMDFDCLGSALGVARFAQALRKPVCIIEKTGGVEEKLHAVINAHMEELSQDFRFVTESEAVNQLQDNTLTIMVDHHNIKQSNGSKLLELAKKVVIIDHHRRSTDMGVKPILVYIEAAASSACELITELMPYVSSRVELSDLDANIMLAGMMIDTNQFHTRTGSRTFDAASALRKIGADPLKVNEFLKDSYDEFAARAAILSSAKSFPNGVITVPYKNGVVTRTLMSQAADQLLAIQNVEAVFVIADTTEGDTSISARSNGHINVQMIMEAMNGGGHMTAAATQRKRCNIDDLEKELLRQIDNYFKEVDHEGNTEK